jgi:hypothetical protein
MTNQNVSIDVAELAVRNVYRLRSRNLEYGVYDGDRGFIGIREKFGYYYLDTEYLGATATPLGLVGRIEEPIELCEVLGSRCLTCRGDIAFVEWGNRDARGRGRWVCADGACTDPQPQAVSNRELFVALEAFEAQS